MPDCIFVFTVASGETDASSIKKRRHLQTGIGISGVSGVGRHRLEPHHQSLPKQNVYHWGWFACAPRGGDGCTETIEQWIGSGTIMQGSHDDGVF